MSDSDSSDQAVPLLLTQTCKELIKGKFLTSIPRLLNSDGAPLTPDQFNTYRTDCNNFFSSAGLSKFIELADKVTEHTGGGWTIKRIGPEPGEEDYYGFPFQAACLAEIAESRFGRQMGFDEKHLTNLSESDIKIEWRALTRIMNMVKEALIASARHPVTRKGIAFPHVLETPTSHKQLMNDTAHPLAPLLIIKLIMEEGKATPGADERALALKFKQTIENHAGDRADTQLYQLENARSECDAAFRAVAMAAPTRIPGIQIEISDAFHRIAMRLAMSNTDTDDHADRSFRMALHKLACDINAGTREEREDWEQINMKLVRITAEHHDPRKAEKVEDNGEETSKKRKLTGEADEVKRQAGRPKLTTQDDTSSAILAMAAQNGAMMERCMNMVVQAFSAQASGKGPNKQQTLNQQGKRGSKGPAPKHWMCGNCTMLGHYAEDCTNQKVKGAEETLQKHLDERRKQTTRESLRRRGKNNGRSQQVDTDVNGPAQKNGAFYASLLKGITPGGSGSNNDEVAPTQLGLFSLPSTNIEEDDDIDNITPTSMDVANEKLEEEEVHAARTFRQYARSYIEKIVLVMVTIVAVVSYLTISPINAIAGALNRVPKIASSTCGILITIMAIHGISTLYQGRKTTQQGDPGPPATQATHEISPKTSTSHRKTETQGTKPPEKWHLPSVSRWVMPILAVALALMWLQGGDGLKIYTSPSGTRVMEFPTASNFTSFPGAAEASDMTTMFTSTVGEMKALPTYRQRQQQDEYQAAWHTATEQPVFAASRVWVDSGCSQSVFHEKDKLINIRPCKREIIKGMGGNIETSLTGDYPMEVRANDGKIHKIIIQNCLYAPEGGVNLLSVGQLSACGVGINIPKFNRNAVMNFTDNNNGKELYVEIPTIGNLYFVSAGHRADTDFTMQHGLSAHNLSDAELWHLRLAHCPFDKIYEASARSLGFASKIKPPPNSTKHSCHDCADSNIRKRNKPAASTTTGTGTWSLDLVDMTSVPSLSGFRYLSIFVIHDSRFTMVFAHKTKDEAPTILLKAFAQAGYVPKILRTDSAAEYCTPSIDRILLDRGIDKQYSNPYEQHGNAKAETMVHAIGKGIRCQLLAANGPPEFWAFAAINFIDVYNRLPHASLGGKSPWEIEKKSIPNLSWFKPFGCRVTVYLGKDRVEHHKISPRGEPAVYLGLGFSKGMKGWLCYSPRLQRLFCTRNCIFDETFMPLRVHDQRIRSVRDPITRTQMLTEAFGSLDNAEGVAAEILNMNIPFSASDVCVQPDFIETTSDRIPQEHSEADPLLKNFSHEKTPYWGKRNQT